MKSAKPQPLTQPRINSLLNQSKKPIPHILAIKNAIIPYGTRARFPRGEKMWFSRDGIRYCYLLLSGEVSVCRVGDDFKIANFSAPALGGVAESFYPKEKFYFLAESPVEVIMSPEADVLEVITRKNLWQHIVHIQAYLIQMLGTRDVLLSGNSTYEIICNHLLMLMSEKEVFRLSTTVPRYIQQRTQLSRSSIMKILSELRKGNYITIDKGILHTINNLPKNY